MTRLRLFKYFSILLLALILGLGVYLLNYASHFGKGWPYSLRLPEIVYEIPGVVPLLEWRARAHAQKAYLSDHRYLFGAGYDGSYYGEDLPCTLLLYNRDRSSSFEEPPWLNGGLHGVATFDCYERPSSAKVTGANQVSFNIQQFISVEIGCIASPLHTYSNAFNKEMLQLVKYGD